MKEKDYTKDFKNLQPLPLDRIPVGSPQSTVGSQRSTVGSQELKPVNNHNDITNSTINTQHSTFKEVKMERLTNSKTLWGFGIAVFIYILQNVLIALNIAGPDNLILKAIIEAIIAISGFFGVYGVRDALRKMNL